MLIRNGLLITLVALLSTSIYAGQIYKTTDENGNTVFTDSPQEGQHSEQVKLKPLTTITQPPVEPLPKSTSKQPDEDQAFAYNSLRILTPEAGETIRNTPVFEVVAGIDPNMLPRHSAVLLVDGQPFAKQQNNLTFVLSDIDRGTHTLEVQVLDADGKLQISHSIEIFIHRNTQSKRTPRAGS